MNKWINYGNDVWRSNWDLWLAINEHQGLIWNLSLYYTFIDANIENESFAVSSKSTITHSYAKIIYQTFEWRNICSNIVIQFASHASFLRISTLPHIRNGTHWRIKWMLATLIKLLFRLRSNTLIHFCYFHGIHLQQNGPFAWSEPLQGTILSW